MSASRDSSAPLDRFYSVIPAGGIGSRLWPLSRADAPKFLHDLTGSGTTLLRATWERLAPLSETKELSDAIRGKLLDFQGGPSGGK